MTIWRELDRRKLNPVGSVVGSLSTAVSLFLIFRFAVIFAGVEALGVWSLLQGVMVFSRISDVGAGTNLTRLIAVQVGEHGAANFRVHLATGMLLSTFPTLILGLIVVLASAELLHFGYPNLSIPRNQLSTLIWSSFLVAVLQSLGNLVAGCLDGYGRMFERGIFMAVANGVTIPVSYILIREYGVVGIGFSYIFLAGLFLLGSASYLLLLNFRQSAIPMSNVLSVARASWKVSVGMIYIGVLRLIFEPTSKILIGEFGGLHAVAVFDLANRVTAQIRMLLSSASQSLLPLLARHESADVQSSRSTLLDWSSLLERWAWYAFGLEILSAPLLSHLAFGEWNANFGIYFLSMGLANTLNAFGLTAYYSEVARGYLGSLVRIHIIMAILNVFFGALLGVVIGAYGVVIASAVSIAYGGLACLRLSQVESTRSIRSFFSLRGQFAEGLSVTALSLSILLSSLYLSGTRDGVFLTSVSFMGMVFLSTLLLVREVTRLSKSTS